MITLSDMGENTTLKKGCNPGDGILSTFTSGRTGKIGSTPFLNLCLSKFSGSFGFIQTL
jgi:hypothetical protein